MGVHSGFTADTDIDMNSKLLIGLKVFTTAPTLGQMSVGEIALGNGTGGGGENEFFVKVSGTEIARFVRDSNIT